MVFNTSITGYQEILTDSFLNSRQIVTLTLNPHIGNAGTNEADNKSTRVPALVIQNLPPLIASNFRDTLSLSDYLKQQNIVGIAEPVS